jgi:hypothetical protein
MSTCSCFLVLPSSSGRNHSTVLSYGALETSDQRWKLSVVRRVRQQVVFCVPNSPESRAAMNPRENLESIVCLGLLITCHFCEKSLLTECIPSGVSPMPLSVSKKQSTHSVKGRAERGRAMTERDRNGPACRVGATFRM